MDGVIAADRELIVNDRHGVDTEERSFALTGINRRLRVYRYAPNSNERFAPHIDAGFPPGGTSLDDVDDYQNDDDDTRMTTSRTPYLHWDATHQYQSSLSVAREVVSRLTVLIYLNDDFTGGHTKFYEPACERESILSAEEGSSVIASIKPRAGSMLVFPQAVSESAVERARNIWPLHEGSPVTSTTDSSNRSRPKYVIRTDVLFETITTHSETNESLPPEEKMLFQHDDVVRNVFLNASPMFSTTFLHHVWPLYNPHMGVENVGPLLYSLVRFTKVRNIVEVGAGYTTLFLLQALKDNDNEMHRIVKLDGEDKLRLLDYPFGTPKLDEWASTSSPQHSVSSLLCIDNCEHQKETASSAVHVSRTLNLDPYLQFLKGDAFDALDTHFSQDETIDMLWCDFGVGNRMMEYVSRVWRYIRPGGFLVCHSTLTNERTRVWLEGVRRRAGVDITGIPADEYVELSLLEPPNDSKIA
jgi:predicted O-methyltransferase YrrM